MKKIRKTAKKGLCALLVMQMLMPSASAFDMSTYSGVPFLGEPFIIGDGAAVINFCDFDEGAEGVTYEETDSRTTEHYRSGAVDVFNFGGGRNTVNYLAAGEWLNYTVKVKKTGFYDFDLGSVWSYLAEPSGVIHLEMDGKNLTGPVKISETSDLTLIPRQVFKNIYLEKGDHILKLVVEQSNGGVENLIITPSANQGDLLLRSLNVNKTSVVMSVGDIELLSCVAQPSAADISGAVWASDNEQVARVNDRGVVEAVAKGIASIKVTAGGKTASCKVNVIDAAADKPYKEFILKDSLVIPCADYNIGENTVAYYRLDEGKNTYYRNGDIRIEGERTTYYVCDTLPGEWIKYTFTCEEDEYFDIGVLANTESGSGSYTLMMDKDVIIENGVVQSGHRWDDFSMKVQKEVLVSKGTHTFKLFFNESGGMYHGISMTKSHVLDNLQFDNAYKGTPYGGEPISIGVTETVFPLWQFDEGGSGVAYYQSAGEKVAGDVAVRKNENIFLWNYYDGYTTLRNNNAGEWINYTISIDKSGYYDIKIATAWSTELGASGAVHLEMDGVPITEQQAMPVTDGYNNWKKADLGTVYLPSGKHLLKLVIDKTGNHYTELSFALNKEAVMTKADFAVAVADKLLDPISVTDNFADVTPDKPYYDAVGTLKHYGVLKGGGDGKFNPDVAITKEQGLHILAEALKATGRMINTGNGITVDKYADAYSISPWAKSSMEALANAGFMIGAQGKIEKDTPVTVALAGEYLEFAQRCVAMNKEVPQIEPIYIAEDLSPAYDWIEKDFLRGIYGFHHDIDHPQYVMDKMADWGINMAVIHVGLLEHETPDGFYNFASRCKSLQDKTGVRMFLSIPYGTDEYYKNTQFGAYASGSDVKWVNTPCPLSEGYWNAVVGDRMAVAAEIGLAGSMADMEMYGADSTMLSGPCYCDSCWSRFIKEFTAIENPLLTPEEKRSSALVNSELTLDYARWQEIEVAKILRKIEQRVHAINPDFILGNILYMESLPGLSRGFGTPTMPSLIFSETEYSGGISGVPRQMETIKNGGYPSLYISGFWPNPLNPDALKENIIQATPACNGYWMWSSGCLGSEYVSFKQDENYTAQEYVDAVTAANNELDEMIKSGNFKKIEEKVVAPTYTAALVDGEPTESDWEKAPFTADFLEYNNNVIEVTSRAKMLWNGEKLFIRVHNDEPQMHMLASGNQGRDDPGLWGVDCNEIYWKFADEIPYQHFIVARDGAYSDYYGNGFNNDDIGRDYEAETKAFATDKGWGIEISFTLDMDARRQAKSGDLLSVEIGRYRPLDGVTSCWGPTFGAYKGAPNLWGKVTLE